ncbi:MAG TPA: serine/threonine-protein kinase [Gemmatimonadales bacterium]|nr:serine/threonine-protein kinase [Gemmatimonadales bacterium]
MHDTPPVDLLGGALKALRGSFRFDHLVALSRERALYQAYDVVLKRPVALRLHLIPDSPGRAWFLRETETLAALDHPAVRHVYAAGEVEAYAYRTNNWIDGESLADAMHRGSRPVPAVMSLARDLLSALEHAHARNIIIRRIVPTTLMLDVSGRGVVTDLRHANTCMAFEATETTQTATPFCAPEVRAGGVGEPASDVYAVAANLYYALTGQEPAADGAALVPPRKLRAAVPAAVERVLLRALRAKPGDRYYTATEMLEDLVVDAGGFHEPAAEPQIAESGFERRLRRALGDDYELLEELGSGGFGRVYRARDLGLEREVAIKVLHPALTADLGVVERFRREAQLAARLSHPNIVGIYDIQGRAGLQWYVMELVLGENLAQRVQRHGALSLKATERLLSEALSALEHAHAKGLVHRDLKPENTLIEPDGRLRITDFGLALALRGERFGGATSRSGTPQFAAPEQLLGERVDPRTDLYSLGAVVYFALLGRPPFDGISPEAILAQQTTDKLPRLTEERSDVPRELEEVLRRAVASAPADRYPSAQAFREAVERVAGGFWHKLLLLLRPA